MDVNIEYDGFTFIIEDVIDIRRYTQYIEINSKSEIGTKATHIPLNYNVTIIE